MSIVGKVVLQNQIAAKHGLTKVAAGEIVDSVLEAIAEGVESGNKVRLPGVGSFEKVAKPSRNYVHPATKQMTKAPEGERVRFRASSKLV